MGKSRQQNVLFSVNKRIEYEKMVVRVNATIEGSSIFNTQSSHLAWHGNHSTQLLCHPQRPC